MRFTPKALGINTLGTIAFAAAAGLSFVAAGFAADALEDLSARSVRKALLEEGYTWASVTGDGLNVIVTGEAPTEALRFRALGAAGSVVDSGRIIDSMTVPDPAAIAAPDFSLEILRNDAGISLIGLIPASSNREDVLSRVTRAGSNAPVTDMLDTADNPAPSGWPAALDFGLKALRDLPRAKISISPEHVSVTAITDSEQQKQRLERRLRGEAPLGMVLSLNISAPRPVLTPFTLRFLIDENGPHFDACSADSDEARDQILAAAKAAGAPDGADCTVGLGVPSPDWAKAAVASIKALTELGGGSVTLSDADVSLIAADTVSQEDFDRVAGELDTALPPVFSLKSVLTPKPQADGQKGPPRLTARLDKDGQVQIRGLLSDERTRDAVESFADARFGSDRVYAATRLETNLPQGWPVRVLAGLEALSRLEDGQVEVRPDLVRVSGRTGDKDTSAEIARMLSERLGTGEEYEISVKYDPKLDPVLALPSADECIARIKAVQKGEDKITFEPGSARLSGPAQKIMDQLAEAMRDCSDYPMQVAGYTDSQGREEMNQRLSEDRARAVVEGLMQRRILTGNLTAVGFGEADPIADNGTEDGREANRRIEFSLLPAAADDDGTGDGTGDAAPQTDTDTDTEGSAAEKGDASAEPNIADTAIEDDAEGGHGPAMDAIGADESDETAGQDGADAGDGSGDADAPAEDTAATVSGTADTGTAAPAIGSPEAVKAGAEADIRIEAQTADDDTVHPRARPESTGNR